MMPCPESSAIDSPVIGPPTFASKFMAAGSVLTGALVHAVSADIEVEAEDVDTDKAQAKATLQVLNDNYPVDSDGILDEVRSKLDSLNAEQVSPSDSSAVNRK